MYDADATWSYRRLDSVNEWLTGVPATLEDYRSSFADPGRLAATVIVEVADDPGPTVIGDFMLRLEDAWSQAEVSDTARHAQAELGWVLDPAHTGLGYATEAVRELLRYCFDELDVHRVVAGCFLDNDASSAAHGKGRHATRDPRRRRRAPSLGPVARQRRVRRPRRRVDPPQHPRTHRDPGVPMNTTTHQAQRPEEQRHDPASAGPRHQAPGLHEPTRAEQRTARIMGAWFLGTFVFSVPAFWFYDPLLNQPATSSGAARTAGRHGSPARDLLAVCGIATAVVIFPIVEGSARARLWATSPRGRWSRSSSWSGSSACSRRGSPPGRRRRDPRGALLGDARALLALHGQASLLGPQLCAGLGNGILLGSLMWRTRLLPAAGMVIIGLVGGPLALLAGIGVLLGVWDLHAGLPVVMTAPEAFWELSLSLWLLVKGSGRRPC